MEPVTTQPKVTDRVGRYRILSELGRGSMAQVYLALDPNIDREVAIKVFLPRYEVGPVELNEMRRRFIEEAKAAGRVRHPGIVTIYDADTDAEHDLSYIAMERIEGRSLWEILAEDGPMPELPAIEIIGKVALALHAAHEEGLVHLDVKPGNILCGLDGSIKVTDFGIAQLATRPDDEADWISGSPFYMSPEQIAGGEVDSRSDVYSLGAVLYECLCGAVPLTSESFDGLRYMIREIDPRPLQTFDSRIRGELACVAMKALSKSPGDRFQTTYDLAQALGSAVSVAPILLSARARAATSAGAPSQVSPTPPVPEPTPSRVEAPVDDVAAAVARLVPAHEPAAPPQPIQRVSQATSVLEIREVSEIPEVRTVVRKPAAAAAVEPQSPSGRGFAFAAGFALLLAFLAAALGVFAVRGGWVETAAIESWWAEVSGGSRAAEPPRPSGPRVVIAPVPTFESPRIVAGALEIYDLIDPPQSPSELEAEVEAVRQAQRRRRANVRSLAQEAVEAKVAEVEPQSVAPITVVEELEPVDEGPVVLPMATLEVVFRNRLKSGAVSISIDGREVWTEEFSGSKNVFRRTLGKDVSLTLPIPAGERAIDVRVTGSQGKVDLTRQTSSSFEEGEVRRLRVVHIPPRALKLSWKDDLDG